jgi:hypothetical protein
VGLSNRELQSHLDSLEKSVLLKFELTVVYLCRIHVVPKKSSYQEHLQITLKFRLNYAVLHISSEHWTAQLTLLNSSEPPEENVVYGIVSLT